MSGFNSTGSFGFGSAGSGGGGGGLAKTGFYTAVVGEAGGPVAGTSTYIPLDGDGNPILIGKSLDFMIYASIVYLSIVSGSNSISLNSTTGEIDISNIGTWSATEGLGLQYRNA